jgi:hypothetical protein
MVGRRRRRERGALRTTGLLAVTVVLASCSTAPLTSAEYSARVTVLITDVTGQLDVLAARRAAEPPGMERTRAYLDGRAAAREEFLDEFTSLDPPEEYERLHDVAVGIMTRLTEAEVALAAMAQEAETEAEVWDSFEARVAASADQESIALCRLARSELSRISDLGAFGISAWFSPGAKEIVDTAFGCTPEERGAVP